MRLNADELNTRHGEFLREIRQATMAHVTDVKQALELQAEAQRRYAAWFAQYGVELFFPD